MFYGTTIIGVSKDGHMALAGDGQVTLGSNHTIMKHNAKKIRKLYNNRVVAGFAGSVADAFTLFENFEGKLEEYNGDIQRASVELTKNWRMDKMLRRLEALLIVADKDNILILSGSGEVIQPDEGIAAIGSGGAYAHAAAKALLRNTDMKAPDIARESLEIAASICIYTNDNIIVEEL
ncbi:MAG: ATP-dependent protease subunit HslV [Clostridia bacterium]|nr:ATP-dependent protease subunit HslV [Clostridia bacterium]